MSIGVIMEVVAPAEKADALAQLLKDIIPDTRAYAGCEDIRVLRNSSKPEEFVIVEQWKERAAYDAYLAWRKQTGLPERMGAVLAAPPRVRFFEVTPY